MKGDRLVIRPGDRRVASEIAAWLIPRLDPAGPPHVVSIAGESGSGKSVLAAALVEELASRGFQGTALQQDDYFVLPPATNHQARLEDLGWVGPGEVRLELLDNHLRQAIDGAAELVKPLVLFDENRIVEERLPLEGVRVLLVEGTYTSLLRNVDTRVFIDRTFRETRNARQARGREAQSEFLDRVLELEHRIISRHRERADLVVGRRYDLRPGPACRSASP